MSEEEGGGGGEGGEGADAPQTQIPHTSKAKARDDDDDVPRPAAIPPATLAEALSPSRTMAQQHTGLDEKGDGTGCIVTPNGDVYEGEIRNWKREGLGLQRWATGEIFEGTWKNDQQAVGLFTDSSGRKWQGDFVEKTVQLLMETESTRPKQSVYKKKGGTRRRGHRTQRSPRRPLQTTAFTVEQGRAAIEGRAAAEANNDSLMRFTGDRFRALPNDQLKENTPGPGTYETPVGVKGHHVTSPRYSIGHPGRSYIDVAKKISESTPGPIYKPEYDPKLARKKVAFIRDNAYVAAEPLGHLGGPGPKYDPHHNLADVNHGVYSHIGRETTFGQGPKNRNKFQYRGKFAEREYKGVAGPGPIYDPVIEVTSNRHGAPSHRMRGRVPDPNRKDPTIFDGVPGAGKYNPNRLKHKRSSYSATFGTFTKSFDPNVKTRNIAYTSRRHTRENLNTTSQGPAHYSPLRAEPLTKPVAPSIGFGPHTRFIPARAH